jgi:hypothetical protein
MENAVDFAHIMDFEGPISRHPAIFMVIRRYGAKVPSGRAAAGAPHALF